jgi:hypothetical protein
MTLLVSDMPMALIGLRIASVRVVFGDTMSTEQFAARQSRVGPLWPSIEALLEPFLITNRSTCRPTLELVNLEKRLRNGWENAK